MSTNFDDFLEQQLSDPELRREYDAQQPEHAIIQTMIDARKHAGRHKKNSPSALESPRVTSANSKKGNANPSLRTLQRLASGMGMTLRIEFSPMREVQYRNV